MAHADAEQVGDRAVCCQRGGPACTGHDFSGRTGIVIGAAAGIGRARARAVADAGAAVTLLDVNDELGASAAEDAGGIYVHLDVSRPDAWIELLAGFERLDL